MQRSFFLAPVLLSLVSCSSSPPRTTNLPPLRAIGASAAATPLVPPTWTFPMAAQSPPSPHGAITTDCALATKVGLDVLQHGGNAVDAIVATAFAEAVAYPTAGNVGGGGFAVVRFGTDERALDFREAAPAAASRDMYAGATDGGSRSGWRSSGTPGSTAGLWALHQAKGSKPWKELLAPAIAMARDGFVVDEAFSAEVADHKERLAKDPASAALFLPGGAPPAVGSTWKNPDLARVLQRISDDGPKGFYQGPTADAIASAMKSHGGLITADDLKSYEAKWRDPLVFTYRGNRIVAMPPPSSGGVTLAMIAHILEGFDLPREGWHSPTELHDFFEAERRAFAARNARLGDPDFVKNPLGELLSKDWADSQRATIRADKATPSSEVKSIASPQDGPHTTNMCAVDASGNAVALTTTVNWFFGNGITVEGTGMILNNEMDDFASVPGSANGFGLVQGEPNAIGPKKRMLSSMSPIVVASANGSVQLVAGAAGGPRIISAVAQVLLSTLDHGLDPIAALNGPRFHMQHMPDLVFFEKNGLDATLRTPLEAMGYTFKESAHIADGNAIGRVPGGWLAAPELRRPGSFAAGY